ncbi:MAG: QueT transporter family protein [Candidatus Bathyarchaeia archaeon]
MKPSGRLDGYASKSLLPRMQLRGETKTSGDLPPASDERGNSRRRMDARELSLTAIFAALYAVLVVFLLPVSFGPAQLRVADALISLAALFGWPVVLGVTLGAVVSNIIGGLGVIDVVFGPVANLVAASLIFALRKRRFLACVVGSLPIGFIVGAYLPLFFPPPEIFGLNLSPWLAMVISITLSSLIAIAGIGYMLLTALSRPGVAKPLVARGLKLYLGEET